MQTSPKPVTVADRLGSTLFIAALVHGVVILGVTFTAGSFEEAQVLPSLNVTLIVDAAPSDEPVDSDLFAAHNLRGGGNLAEGERPTTALGADQPRDQAGEAVGADAEAAAPQSAPQADELLTASERNAPRPAAEDPLTPAAAPQHAAALVSDPFAPTLAAEVDVRAEAPRQEQRELIATPSTQESALAPYLEAWRRRVERVGTVNFPAELSGAGGRPTLEVAIAADGRLQDIVVRRSSGNSALDQAALTILRLAAPFEPLPEAIRRDYDVLRFAYEWEFLGGAVRRGAGLAAAD